MRVRPRSISVLSLLSRSRGEALPCSFIFSACHIASFQNPNGLLSTSQSPNDSSPPLPLPSGDWSILDLLPRILALAVPAIQSRRRISPHRRLLLRRRVREWSWSNSLAMSKRNHKICLDRVSKSEERRGHITLEELLVEETWFEVLPREFQKPYTKNLSKFIEKEICSGGTPVYPPSHLIFNALNTIPFHKVKVVVLGQDPYHGPGQAMGLSFSVPGGVKIPSSLVNIFKELHKDLGCSIPSHGNLERWALQGLLLLNTVLTAILMQKRAGSSSLILSFKPFLVFLLWGNSAQEKARLINANKHHILKAAHPSGLSAHRGFFRCRHFSCMNQILEQGGETSIDWQL